MAKKATSKKNTVHTSARFSALDSLSFGWHSLQNNFGKAMGMSLLYLILVLALGGIGIAALGVYNLENSLGKILTNGIYYALRIALTLVTLALSLGWIKASIGFAEGKPSWQDISAGLKIWPVLSYFFGQLVYNIIMLTSILVCLLPVGMMLMLMGYSLVGISSGNIIAWVIGFGVAFGVMFFVALEFMLFPFLIVDKNAGPIKALQGSSKLCRGSKWSLLGLILISMLVNIGGLLAFGVGLLITMPWTWIAFGRAYVTLRDSHKLN